MSNYPLPIPHKRVTRLGAMAVVVDEQQRVLLHRREIYFWWDLPGGGLEKREDGARAAIRETWEETGYHIAIEKFVGDYYHQSVYGFGDQLTKAYRAHVVGGAPRPYSLETLGLEWFPIDALPRGIEPLQRQIILDAFSETDEPFTRRIEFPNWKLYPARVIFFMMRWRNFLLKPFFHHQARQERKEKK